MKRHFSPLSAPRARRKLCASLVSVFAAASAFGADQLTISGGAKLELHDNAPLTEKKESDLVRIASVDVGYKKPEGSVTADLDYRAERRDYLHKTQGNENLINGNAALKWLIEPKRLEAMLYHQISSQITNRRGTDVSSNREERSIITAGVDGYLHFSPVDSLVISPRYADVNFQQSTSSNSQHSSAAATWEHKLGALSALNLTGTYDHATFDESSNDYDAQSVILGYGANLSRLSYQVGAGYNRLSRDEGDDVKGSLFRAGVDYRGEQGLHWGATFAHQLTDSSIGFSGLELTNSNFQSNDSNFNQPSTLEKDQFDVFLDQRITGSSTIRAGAGYLKDNYKNAGTNAPVANPGDQSAQDQSVEYVSLGYVYTLNSYWSMGLDGRWERTKFLDDPENLRYDTIRTYANVTYSPLQRLQINLSVGRDKRNANNSTNDYTDNVAILGAQYRFY